MRRTLSRIGTQTQDGFFFGNLMSCHSDDDDDDDDDDDSAFYPSRVGKLAISVLGCG